MTTMADLDEFALSVQHVSDDGRPAYLVDGKLLCSAAGRQPRRSAITG